MEQIILIKPTTVYNNRVTITWEVNLGRPLLFDKTVVKRDGIQFFETNNVDVTECIDDGLSGENATYIVEVHLKLAGEDGNKIDFSNESEYEYNNEEIEISDGSAKFYSLKEITQVVDSSSLLSDNNTEVVDGKLQLKEVI